MKIRIPFNRPPYTGNEEQYVLEAMRSPKISGDGQFSRRCQTWFEQNLPCQKALLTPSCTQALEMAALLLDIKPGDEIIMPSYTFVSTANAFALRGGKIVFVDIRPDTMNIDEMLIEAAITDNTKAIVPIHYAGVACDMDKILELAARYSLEVVEDAAQGAMATYRGKHLGTFGSISAISFHETKNYSSGGEGGLLIINDSKYVEHAEIIREKGTNRNQFFRGMVDKYSWIGIGSSYLPSDIQAAYLWGQLEKSEEIYQDRLATWKRYSEEFQSLEESGLVELSSVPPDCEHVAHMFYLKLGDLDQRTEFIKHMLDAGILAVFHYVPLHSSIGGQRFGRFHGQDIFTTRESERIVRLPMWYGISSDEVSQVIHAVKEFFLR